MYDVTTPDGVRDKLDKELVERQADLKKYEDYYEGRQQMAFASQKFRSTFGRTFANFADNWCGLIVDSCEERLNIQGFRMSADDQSGDQEAWRIWQTNGLDLDSQLAHTDALVFGSSYITVWAGDDPRTPSITVESARQMIIGYSAGSRRKRVAAWKRWIDDDDYVYGTLYLADAIYKYRSQSKQSELTPNGPVSWIPRPGEEAVVPNPLGVVPVVELKNMPRIMGPGRSEIAQIMPIQDATNKLIADMMIAAEYSAFRQRWVTGLDIPTDENGNPIEPFEAAVNRVWHAESAETKFGEFNQTDLLPYVRAVELLVQHAATISRTPPHYFLLNGGQAPSGEAITSAEAGLVAKVKRKMRSFEEGWEEVMRLAFAVLGDDQRAAAFDAQVMWGDPAYRSQSALVDALTKLAYIGVPAEQLWLDAGYSPQQVERFKEALPAVPTEQTMVPSTRAVQPQIQEPQE